jgi:Ca-activated chloride channel family protein
MYAPEIIVLLTDGVSNAGPLPLDAAQQAADRGVRVYTIGFGTENGPARFGGRDPYGMGGGSGGQFGPSPGGQGQGSGGFRRGIDEATLKKIAEETGGTYYAASSASELLDVFRSLPTYLIVKHETLELSVVFAAVGMLLSALAVGLSLIWHPML